MNNPAPEIARRLADHAEAVCRRYLSKGHREGRYWLVGDVRNTPGRSLYVRLAASPDGRGAAGKWTDAATGDHGDLLDIIAIAQGTRSMRETLDEARRFLSLPMPDPDPEPRWRRPAKAASGTPEAAGRLFGGSASITGSVVQAYLETRAITVLRDCDALRFKPGCYYRPSKKDAPGTRSAWPAMIAAVTDLDGRLTGVHRTWLDPAAAGKAPVAYPRRAMGLLLGNGVRLGKAGPVMFAGEGIETMLSLRQIAPAMPAIAGLSGAHLAAILFPPQLRRLYVARDDDPTGDAADKTLAERAAEAGIETMPLLPQLDDFNSDLRLLGKDRLRTHLLPQLKAEDAERFLLSG
ncbi:MAG: toprim domain-containing protein [Altererythrobacter sp.]|nr:toprim domain-containing protein [Altererythrobacter sp.]OJU59449.1 MAG: DNA primase [Altererythrobacter sp. 66-12]